MACATRAAATNARTRTPRPGPRPASGVSSDGGSEPPRPWCWPAPGASSRNRRSRRRSGNRQRRRARRDRRNRNRRARRRNRRNRNRRGNRGALGGDANGERVTLRRGCVSGAAPSVTARTGACAPAAGPRRRRGNGRTEPGAFVDGSSASGYSLPPVSKRTRTRLSGLRRRAREGC